MPLTGDFPFSTVGFRKPFEGVDPWLVPNLIPREGVVILASAPKTGKTCLATAIARSVALGTPFLGQPVEQGAVVWCAHEEVPEERSVLHAGLTDEDPFFIAYCGELPLIDSPEPGLDWRGEYIEQGTPKYVFDHAGRLGAKLVVIDCLHAAVERGNLADNAFARRIVSRLRRLSYRRGIAVLILHHLTKSTGRPLGSERFADSAQILAAASCHFTMERAEEEDGSSRVTLCGQGRHPSPPRKLELISNGVLDYRLAPEEEKTIKGLSIAAQVSALLAEGWELTSEEIAKRLALKPAAVRNALASLANEGRAEKLATGERRSRYRLLTSA